MNQSPWYSPIQAVDYAVIQTSAYFDKQTVQRRGTPAFKRKDPPEIIEDARLILLHLQLHSVGRTGIAVSPSSILCL